MLHALLCALYFSVLLGLSSFGLHRLHLVILCARHRKAIQKAQIACTFDMPVASQPGDTVDSGDRGKADRRVLI